MSHTDLTTSAAAVRATLAGRSGDDSPPGAWRAAAAAAGVSGPDAFLCHLSLSIAAALECVTVSAEAARGELRSAWEAANFEHKARFEELEAGVNAAEAAKTMSLERELCTADSALEQLRAARIAAEDAVTSLCDTELVAHFADLTARLDAADALLLALPTAVVEPPYVGLLVNPSTPPSETASLGRIIAPRAVTAADLALESPLHCRPGRALRLLLVSRGAHHASQSAEELDVSLAAAAASVHVEASLEAPHEPSMPLHAEAAKDTPSRGLAITISVSIATPPGSSVNVHVLTVAGRSIGMAAPLCVSVQCGVQIPLSVGWKFGHVAPYSPVISPTGQLFVPQYGTPSVLAFDYDGSVLPSLPVRKLGLSDKTWWAAFADGASPSLLLADYCVSATRVVAVDPASRSVRWATPRDTFRHCCGLTTLPSEDVVFASITDETIYVLRLANGDRVGSLHVPGLRSFLAADPASGALFGNVHASIQTRAVMRYSWAHDTGLRAEGIVAAAGEDGAMTGSGRPLAVIPPVPGKRVSHLVVGTEETPRLLVIALPSLTLVHTHTLAGMKVMALTADPWGGALAVSDYEARAIHVLAWPLPGMPGLE